jgi:hypothetical protein
MLAPVTLLSGSPYADTTTTVVCPILTLSPFFSRWG